MTDKHTKAEHYFAQECMIHGVGDSEVIEAICRILTAHDPLPNAAPSDYLKLHKRLECRAKLDAKLEGE